MRSPHLPNVPVCLAPELPLPRILEQHTPTAMVPLLLHCWLLLLPAGVGKAMAKGLARCGADLALLDLKTTEEIDQAVGDIFEATGRDRASWVAFLGVCSHSGAGHLASLCGCLRPQVGQGQLCNSMGDNQRQPRGQG